MLLTPNGFEPRLDLALDDDTIVHLFVRDRLVHSLDDVGGMRWAQYRAMGFSAERVHSIGRYGGQNHVAVALPDDFPVDLLPPGWKAAGLRQWFGMLDEPTLSLAMRAVQIVDWDRMHRFCGACGTPTELQSNERSRRCPGCGLIVYPRISPAMMVLVTRGRQLLLGRGVNFGPHMYSALAGFLEAGETIEEAVRREVREEVGIEVDHLRYFGSQSWPFPNSLMIAFRAEYAGGDLKPDPAELADAQWFDPENLPKLPGRFSIARELIEDALRELRGA